MLSGSEASTKPNALIVDLGGGAIAGGIGTTPVMGKLSGNQAAIFRNGSSADNDVHSIGYETKGRFVQWPAFKKDKDIKIRPATVRVLEYKLGSAGVFQVEPIQLLVMRLELQTSVYMVERRCL
jgi:hypothetical protein